MNTMDAINSFGNQLYEMQNPLYGSKCMGEVLGTLEGNNSSTPGCPDQDEFVKQAH